MAELGQVVEKVRSKNAGPFWVTLDIFCGTPEVFQKVSATLDSTQVARKLGTSPNALRRFDIADLNVIKFSLPRPQIQGGVQDRDMHGAGWAVLLAEMDVTGL